MALRTGQLYANRKRVSCDNIRLRDNQRVTFLMLCHPRGYMSAVLTDRDGIASTARDFVDQVRHQLLTKFRL